MDMLVLLGLTVTISSWWWIIPTVPTLIFLAFMFRESDAIFRWICLIPILLVWLVYFIIF